MKTLVYLTVSLVLAVVLAFSLNTTGILKVNPNGLLTKIALLKGRAFSMATREADVIPNIDARTNNVTPVPELKTPSSSMPVQAPSVSSNNGAGEESVHVRILEFLSAKGNGVESDIEDSLEQFLLKELGLDQEDAARILRMCFWKGFVTLQDQWRTGDVDRMDVAFRREKTLKQAGFAAKGLCLMVTELQEAEARHRELQHQFSKPITKENKS